MRVRETFPDRVLASADEVVLVDLTPEALIGRLRAGKVYPAERVPAALNNFFRVENLAALREVVLRQTAEEVESKRAVPGRRAARHARGAAGRRGADRRWPSACWRWSRRARARSGCVRRAWRSAQRLGAELDLLYVQPPGAPPRGEEREQLEALRGLASVLGATLLVEEGDDLVDAAARVAAERGTTYVLIGQPRPHTGLRRLGRVAARPAAAQAARGGRAHRGRPSRRLEGARRRVAAGPRRRSGRASCSRSSARRCRMRRSTPRCGWPARRTRRSCPPTW